MGQAKQRGTKEERTIKAIIKNIEQKQREQIEMEEWKRNHPPTPEQLKARQVLTSILTFACFSIRK